MKKTEIRVEEILTLLVYGFDLLSRPTFQNWDQSYECWLSRNGMLRRMQYLEAQKYLAREGGRAAWVYRLTESGRQRALGDNVEQRWSRPWDGVWRMLIFDLPVEEQQARQKLLRWLHRRGFGYLQDSVWIHTDPVDDLAKSLKPFRDDVESFTILECRCAAGFSNSALVRAAWSFDTLNEAYQIYQRFAKEAISRLRSGCLHPSELFALLREERERWTAALDRDPLLPRTLWPETYEAPSALKVRKRLLALLPKQVKGTSLSHR